ncbi:matrix metalloproteinase-15 [Ictalurus punctatus]|uniref:Matrix metalloproteinase-14 n=1 Tax=Ictalurus punctatus TaxID=7998 RepID=W5UIG6_ICTPU|nr:matrix metalloproteinase-15 [Ictalurus punctatus]
MMCRPFFTPAVVFSVLVLVLKTVGVSAQEDEFNAETWLRTYGYLSQASRQMSTMQSAQILSTAIKDMQRFYSLDVTGQVDPATLKAMRRPRCGLPDRFEGHSEGSVRRKRFALTGQRWDKDKLTYSIQNHPPSISHQQSHEAIRKAFRVWENVTPLRFKQIPYRDIKNGSEGPDIILLFASGYHGDTSLFDGEGGSLAHAFFPGPGIGGDTHFDMDEPWTLNQREGTGIDLFLVAVHELGHAMGLEHSNDASAIMAPFYQWMDTESFSLGEDDISGIQQIYGPPVIAPTEPLSTTTTPSYTTTAEPEPTSTTTTTEPLRTTRHPERHTKPPERATRPPERATEPWVPPADPGPTRRSDQDAPDICDGDFNTIAVLRGEMFVFKGRWFWRVRRNRVLDNYPMPISFFWVGLPEDIDAAYERHDGKFVFFKGSKYWLFREADVLPGYPQELMHYGQGMPDRVDTAVWWEPSGYTYFFRGDRYWRFSEESRAVDKDYPRPISVWGSIPASPKGAFLSDDGAYTYFYKGTKYWRVDNKRMKVDTGYPRSILNDFMGCHVHFDPGSDTDIKPDPKWPETGGKDQDDNDDDYKDNDVNNDDGEDDDDDDDKKVVVQVKETNDYVMTLILVMVPLVLVLCILGAIYVIITKLQKKETPKVLVHCRRSLQEWV